MNQFVERLNLRLPLNQTEPENVVKKAFAFGFKQPMSNYIAFKVSTSGTGVSTVTPLDQTVLNVFLNPRALFTLHTPLYQEIMFFCKRTL